MVSPMKARLEPMVEELKAMVRWISPTEEDVDTSQESSFQIMSFIKRRDCLRHCLKTIMRLILQTENNREKWLEFSWTF